MERRNRSRRTAGDVELRATYAYLDARKASWMQILELATGNVSLEFRPDEAGEVFRRLESFGKIRRSKGVVHDLITIGDIEFVHYFEWDEPCLIAASETGTALLRKLVDSGSRSHAA
jgi:hypothetical protein